MNYAPTTPAIALQLHLKALYPSLVKYLEQTGIKEASSLPRRIADSDRTKEVRELMIRLHQLFQQYPQLQERHVDITDSIDQLGLDKENTTHLKSLIALYANGDNRYLKFYGGAGTIPTIPYSALWETNNDAEKNLPDLNGKVVFVGYSDPYDPGQPDRFYTVFTNEEGVDLSGVEIAATAFGNLLNDQNITLPESIIIAGIVFVFGAFIGALVFLLPAIVSVPLSLMISAGYVYYVAQSFIENNLWLPLAVPLVVQLPLTLILGLSTQYLSERRKKKWATQAISYYIPENLVNRVYRKKLGIQCLE